MQQKLAVLLSWRRLVGVLLLAFAAINAVLYYNEIGVIAKNKSDLHDLNTQRLAVVAESKKKAEVTPAATARPPTPQPSASATSAGVVGKIKISTATEADFDKLPGIGPSKAKAIIEYRTTHPFKSVSDLKNVKGIGDKTFENLKPYLEL